MFAGEPPSSSDPTKRSFWEFSSLREAFRRLLLQIGGANIASADRALKAAAVVVARGGKNASARSSSERRRARSGWIALLAKTPKVVTTNMHSGDFRVVFDRFRAITDGLPPGPPLLQIDRANIVSADRPFKPPVRVARRKMANAAYFASRHTR